MSLLYFVVPVVDESQLLRMQFAKEDTTTGLHSVRSTIGLPSNIYRLLLHIWTKVHEFIVLCSASSGRESTVENAIR